MTGAKSSAVGGREGGGKSLEIIDLDQTSSWFCIGKLCLRELGNEKGIIIDLIDWLNWIQKNTCFESETEGYHKKLPTVLTAGTNWVVADIL